MTGKRLAVALILLAGAAWVLLSLDAPAVPGDTGTFHVRVERRDATVLYEDDIALENATAFAALVEAGRLGAFAVDHTGVAGRGDVYVQAIAGEGAAGAGGWVYEVIQADGTRRHPTLASDAWPLSAGDAVRWHWTASGVAET